MTILTLKRPLQALSLATVALASAALPSLALSLRAAPSSFLPEAPQSLQIRRGSTRPRPLGPSNLTNGCSPDEFMSFWDKPIYDADGLFVVGWEKVSICLPKDLEPAG
ncbi:hypothetical protein GS597_04900 [Synechococcales cyanobacterium C]|uniref:Uncharacterized protein n=1 Tax=Petrachloros mirabilis ULC683 TaxID=2781853 RepID=A0A8K1ZXU1_9CYAN|nr:hypothetical protein [Petrachloros mirabilis]NCJ05858.1 hypothetical protein [Petrachloros mirabilis ULC683]